MIRRSGKTYTVSGLFQVLTEDGTLQTMRLPGTLAENSVGSPDERADGYPIVTRFTMQSRYEGSVRISRMITFEEMPGKRYFLEVVRTRSIRLEIDGEKVKLFSETSLATPAVFEVTGRIGGSHMLTFLVDNTYQNMPREEILGSDMASEDTATNWSGIIGGIRIREEESCFLSSALVETDEDSLTVKASFSSLEETVRTVTISSPALKTPYVSEITVRKGTTRVAFEALSLSETVRRYDEGDGALYDLKISVDDTRKIVDATVSFGVRSVSTDEDSICLNGRKLFLRGENNRAVHPETAAPPADASYWESLFKTYRSYGLNFVRFESHCPPEEAFAAADKSGMLLFAGLSRKSTGTVSPSAESYYKKELECILTEFGCHPSLIGVTFGSEGEAAGEEEELLLSLLRTAKKTNRSILVSFGTDTLSVEEDVLFVTEKTLKSGTLPPAPKVAAGACHYEMLPDLGEIDLFSGVLRPEQLVIARRAAEYYETLPNWKKYVEESGEWMRNAYLKEIETMRKSGGLAGFLLFGFQDHIGGNGRPTGFLSTHPVRKPYGFSEPQKIGEALAPALLVLSDIKTHLTVGERAQSDVVVINDGKYPVTGILSVPERENGRIERSLSEVTPAGEMTILPGEKAVVGRFSFFASDHTRDSIEERFVTLAFGPLLHTVKFYLFPDSIPVCPENVLEVSDYSERAVEWMRRGGTVFFTIRRSESEKRRGGSVKADHPLFQAFRTEAWFDERWRLFDGCRGFELPIGDEAIVSSLVHPFDGRFPALLFEGRVAAGQFLASSLGLKEKLSEPAARTLLSDIYDYAGSVLFSPAREYRPEELAKILHSIQ